MGVFSIQRSSRTATTHDASSSSAALPVSVAVATVNKRRWSNLVPFVVALVVIAEIAFLGKLDLANNAAIVDFTWNELFSPSSVVSRDDLGLVGGDDLGLLSCDEWLEREDAVEFSRDFDKEPVLVSGDEKDWKSCSVGCQFGSNPTRNPDASFGRHDGTLSVLRSMESAQYYSENNIDNARRLCCRGTLLRGIMSIKL